MDKISPDYLIGYIDGQGNFSIISSHNHYYPKFVVTSKNQVMIRKIQDFFGVGKISALKPRKATHSTIFVYTVTKYDELKKIIDFFSINPPMAKSKEFEKFKNSFISWKLKFIKRDREESIKVLHEAIQLYKDGASIKDIVTKTNVDLKKLYSVLRTEGLKRYNKASKPGPSQRMRL
jgi:hypothetical protein